ncbi:MAG TPA: RNA polymerase sigma factor [archaeon]|nr:RNA polymerase sigma factor [archaeon]
MSDRITRREDLEAYLVTNLKTYQKYARRLCRDLYTFDDAHDVMGQAVVNALQRFRGCNDEEHLISWLYTVVRNTFIDFHRREHRRTFNRADFDYGMADINHSMDGQNQELEKRSQKLKDAIFLLPNTLRDVMILRIYEELSYNEIASRLSLPYPTVVGRVQRATVRLSKNIKI